MPDRSQDFVPETMEAVAATACLEAGLPADDLRFLRLGQNMLFHLPSPGVVVRIARDSSYRADAIKELAIAGWLADEELPAGRVFDIGREQPIDIAGHPVTFWHYLPGRTATDNEVALTGKLLRELHRLPYPKGIEIPELRPLDRVEYRIHRAAIPEHDKEFLTAETDRLTLLLDELSYALPVGVNHGDAHIKNVIVSPDGTCSLIDFEAVSIAHHEWDLAKTATEAAMGMIPSTAYTEFATAYGYDIMRWEGFPTICSAMQLRMVTWLAQNVSHTDAIADEYHKRVDTLRNGFKEKWLGF